MDQFGSIAKKRPTVRLMHKGGNQRQRIVLLEPHWIVVFVWGDSSDHLIRHVILISIEAYCYIEVCPYVQFSFILVCNWL